MPDLMIQSMRHEVWKSIMDRFLRFVQVLNESYRTSSDKDLRQRRVFRVHGRHACASEERLHVGFDRSSTPRSRCATSASSPGKPIRHTSRLLLWLKYLECRIKSSFKRDLIQTTPSTHQCWAASLLAQIAHSETV